MKTHMENGSFIQKKSCFFIIPDNIYKKNAKPCCVFNIFGLEKKHAKYYDMKRCFETANF